MTAIFVMSCLLLLLGIVFLLIYSSASESKEMNVKEFNGKYAPMSGKCFLYKHEKTGIIMRNRNPDKCTLFETEEKAVKFIEEFKNKKTKKVETGNYYN